MQIRDFPFEATVWDQIPTESQAGTTGTAITRTRQFGTVRVRMIEYTAGYLADHWCGKGHIVLLLEGRMEIELADGRRFTFAPGMSCQVADDAETHRASSATGAKLFVVD